MLKIEKVEGKRLKPFQNLLKRISSSTILSTIRAGRAGAEGEMFTSKITKNQVYLEILVSYLINPSEEDFFGSNKIKEENETLKLLNEGIMLKNT